jgi:5'-AMP-activated protein kinase, regulatory beta subunit
MHRSGNEFSYVHNLTRGKHAYKFIVDDEWRFAPDQPTVAGINWLGLILTRNCHNLTRIFTPDIEGRINNFIDVSEFSPYVGDEQFFEKCKDRKILNSEFKDIIPDLDE